MGSREEKHKTQGNERGNIQDLARKQGHPSQLHALLGAEDCVSSLQFWVLDKVIPFILIFQACYLCLIPPLANNRPKFDAGRFAAVGEKSRTASCHPVSHVEETDTFPHPTLLSRRASPKLSPDTLNVNKAGPPHPTHRGEHNHQKCGISL